MTESKGTNGQEAGLAGGVFMVVACEDTVTWELLARKGHLLNRLVTGAGLLCGMGSVITGEVQGKITITFDESGAAVDNCGREIVVPAGIKKEVFLLNV